MPSGHCERASEGLQGFADDPLLFEPEPVPVFDVRWILVSAAVEAAAGEPFFTFMRTQIFTPLGMTETTADSATEPIPNRVTFYFPDSVATIDFGHEVSRTVDYSCFAGAGAFLSTPSNLVRFGMAMSGGKLLQPATVSILQTPQCWLRARTPISASAGCSTRFRSRANRRGSQAMPAGACWVPRVVPDISRTRDRRRRDGEYVLRGYAVYCAGHRGGLCGYTG